MVKKSLEPLESKPKKVVVTTEVKKGKETVDLKKEIQNKIELEEKKKIDPTISFYCCEVKTKSGKKLAVESMSFMAGATINLGDYESARFDTGLTLKPMEEGITPQEIAEFAWDYLRAELGPKIKDARGARTDKK